MANDGAEHSLEIESRTDRLTDLSQGFEFSDRSRQLARPRFQFLEQPDVLDGDHRLSGESFEQLDLLFGERTDLHAADINHPDGNTLTQQRRGQYRPNAHRSSKARSKIILWQCR